MLKARPKLLDVAFPDDLDPESFKREVAAQPGAMVERFAALMAQTLLPEEDVPEQMVEQDHPDLDAEHAAQADPDHEEPEVEPDHEPEPDYEPDPEDDEPDDAWESEPDPYASYDYSNQE